MSRYADRFTALLDACVLGGALRRNMLLSLAEAGLFRPRWSSRILDETQKAITQITKGETDGSRQRAAIEAAFPEAIVSGYEVFEGKLDLPDPKDNHVLAAAISTSAQVIVTDNLADFPAEVLTRHAIDAISADDFIADTIELDPSEAILALRRMRERFANPAIDVPALIHKLEAQGLLQVATIMNEYRAFL
ncbi:MAG: PIN domain-containing protein [Maritimibacter sp.]|jgi:predicted nucleic acid-binding protein|uniref:PIN domain-containing protein n=1 Tax=Maritimibacter sp. TaxID=2003363 RepID=UPI001DB136C2|nr:PIN domain-containing protein [Maritimibacter sp.]MBL6430110.1 PIN domain-containing protein [Maritimibacter sp.]